MVMLQLKSSRPARNPKAPRASTLREAEPAGEPSDVDRVYGEIFDAAMDRRLLPGTKLTESALCAAFECSRGTVRAALARLAHDRLVGIEHNRGAYVWRADAKEVRDVFAMRRALECIVIDMLTALDDVADRLAPLRAMAEREQQAFEQGDRISWLRLSNAFHVELARLLDNQVLTDMLAGLCARTTLIIALGDTAEGSACSYHEHQDILDCLARRDARSAREAMEHHLEDCEERMDVAPDAGADPWSTFQRQRMSSLR